MQIRVSYQRNVRENTNTNGIKRLFSGKDLLIREKRVYTKEKKIEFKQKQKSLW